MNRYKQSFSDKRHKGKMKRMAKTNIQTFREVELKGFSGSFIPKYMRCKYESR